MGVVKKKRRGKKAVVVAAAAVATDGDDGGIGGHDENSTTAQSAVATASTGAAAVRLVQRSRAENGGAAGAASNGTRGRNTGIAVASAMGDDDGEDVDGVQRPGADASSGVHDGDDGVSDGDDDDDDDDDGTDGGRGERGDAAGRSAVAAVSIRLQHPVRTRGGMHRGGRQSAFDFQPDLCKDWKETGTCSFGDDCIYLHDRGTYLQGWGLGNAQGAKKSDSEDVRGDERVGRDGKKKKNTKNMEYALPFACYLCRRSFLSLSENDAHRQFLETSCDHYFCEDCVKSAPGGGTACPQCSKALGGTYSYAHRLLTRLRAAQQMIIMSAAAD